jgi:hydroxymethylpyrimidine pyrophosphatase-like HAD family hydrolase
MKRLATIWHEARGARKRDLGKPYKFELKQLEATYRWALDLDISDFSKEVEKADNAPLLVIGSGGSLSTACLIAALEQRRGGNFASFDSPLLASRNPAFLAQARVFIVSARGRNADVLGFARNAAAAEPVSLTSLCCMANSPLTEVVRRFKRGSAFEFASPCGKDGYLATNSLVALNTVAARAYGRADVLPRRWRDLFDPTDLKRVLARSYGNVTPIQSDEILLLFGADTRPAAVDFESKFHESGLANVQLADYRNFAHGRHLWLAQRPKTTVFFFICRSDKDIAEATIRLLPKSIQTIRIETALEEVGAAFAMQAATFEIISLYGENRGRDPGRPSVPDFGRKLYHLNAFPNTAGRVRPSAILRKQLAWRKVGFPDLPPDRWEAAYDAFRHRICGFRFTQCVVDYDGTVCDHSDRFVGVKPAVAKSLIGLLDAGFNLGVATGRGKSVREALRSALPKRVWNLVTVGFYNGAVVLSLRSDDNLRNQDQSARLLEVANVIRQADIPGIKLTVRPLQVTLELEDATSAEPLWCLTSSLLAKHQITDVRIVASSRSVDVVTAGTSKLNLLKSLSRQNSAGAETLFIGDKPSWPGNDFELLCKPGSLSVDEVGFDLESGWNMAPPGVIGSDALVYYFGQIRKSTKHFRLALRES